MTGDQEISGHFNFRGNVHVRQNFNAHIINGIDPKSFIPLNSKGSINGKTLKDDKRFEEMIDKWFNT